jgi:hypothetical protein
MSELSPAAQAVMDAWWNCSQSNQHGIAATLRAVADQAHPKAHIEDIAYAHQTYVDGWKDALDVIFAIADELKGANQ